MKNFKNTLLVIVLLALNFTLFGQRAVHISIPPQLCTTDGEDPYIRYFISQLFACDDKIDISIELSGSVMQTMADNDCSIKSLDLVSYRNGVPTRRSVNDLNSPTVSFFDLPSNAQYLDFSLEAKDRFGNVVFTTPIRHTVSKPDNVIVSESMMGEIFDMGHARATSTGGPGGPTGPGTGPNTGDVFTFFCGKRINMVKLLSFYQDYLGLSEYQICRMKALFALHNLDYTSTQMVTWTGVYCDLLEEFWEDYVNGDPPGGGEGNGGDESDCQCKVINTSVFVNHSIGEYTGEPLEDCPPVSIKEDHEVWSHEGGYPNTNEESNWVVSKWAYMGAAKSLYTISHHYEGGDGDNDDDQQQKVMSKTLPAAVLKSSITFALKCFEPRNAEISEDCDCEKTIITAGRYNSNINGQAGTDGNIFSSGNGSVNSCMEDFAFFTRFSREGFEMIDMGAVVACVQCESTDDTNFLTDIGSLISSVEDIVPPVVDTSGISLSNIGDFFEGAGQVVDLVGNFFESLETCDNFQDTSFVLFNKTDTYTLTPENDFVSYIVASRATTRTDFTNDEAWSELHLLSNYYLASGLESTGDSTCCNELVGAYTIGHLGEFTESQLATVNGDNVDFEGFEFKINDPKKNGSLLEDGGLYQQDIITLAHLQSDVAQVFVAVHPNFMMDVFGIDCGPGCTIGVDCYYDCGYWGECHDDGEGLMAILPTENATAGQGKPHSHQTEGVELPMPNFIPTKDVNIFPNPLTDGYELSIQYDQAEMYEHVYIFNLAGQLLFDQPIDSDNTNLSIDSANLTNGVNMVMIARKDGSVFVERIIKE